MTNIDNQINHANVLDDIIYGLMRVREIIELDDFIVALSHFYTYVEPKLNQLDDISDLNNHYAKFWNNEEF